MAPAHRDQGKLPWRDLFTPAIELARNGFAISPRLHMLVSRDKGLKILSDEELSRGGVSPEIIEKRMERLFAKTPLMQKIFQVMFHIVNNGYQVFAVGWLLSNGTVKGGTGWGVELAKLFNRPVHLFEQERKEWVSWVNNEWVTEDPVISHKTIAVTGTRNLNDEGRQAIDELFERSFKTSGK